MSPNLFNIYVGDVVRMWKHLMNLGSQISRDMFEYAFICDRPGSYSGHRIYFIIDGF